MPGAQQFDSGGVIRRARAVLTFATAMPTAAPGRGAGADTPTPHPMSLHSALPLGRRFPAIPRIARRPEVAHALARPIARGGLALWRAALEPVLFALLGVITAGSIAGLGMRSLSDERGTATATAEARFEGRATEDALTRAAQQSRRETPAATRWHTYAPARAARKRPSSPALAPRAPVRVGIHR